MSVLKLGQRGSYSDEQMERKGMKGRKGQSKVIFFVNPSEYKGEPEFIACEAK